MIGRPGTRAVLFVLGAIGAASCGATLQTLPSGTGTPAADAPRAFEAAVERCRQITTFSAEMSVSGRASGQRLRGRVLVGLAAPASALLDAAAPFGASLFIYAARDGAVTLLLPREQRVVRGDDPAAVLEAVTGVPLGAAELRRTLTGCAPDGEASGGTGFGADWRRLAVGTSDVWLRRQSDNGWRVVAVVHRENTAGSWRADYADFQGDIPGTVRLTSGDEGGRFDLRLRLSQVDINPPLGPEVFTVAVPAALVPMSLDELRQQGPLAEGAR